MRTPSLILASWVALVASSACTTRPKPPKAAPPPSLGLDADGTYAAYLAARPQQYKMRHQVESHFGPRREVIEGFLVVREPGNFYVNARSPMGPALFEVKHRQGAPLDIAVHLEQLKDQRFARYLARDIERIYLTECPADTPARSRGDKVVVQCQLAPRGEPIAQDAGPDDSLTLILSNAGVPLEKRFSRGGQATAHIIYSNHAPIDGVWLAHRIELRHAEVGYRIHIALLAADLAFDATRIFGAAPALPLETGDAAATSAEPTRDEASPATPGSADELAAPAAAEDAAP